jgi:HlyD family secretion protein
MKNIFFGFLFACLLGGLIWFVSYIITKSNTPEVVYETDRAVFMDLYKKTMATGSILPRKEVNVKSAVSGLLDELYVGSGSVVKKGDLIAKIKIIPNTESLTRAKAAVKSSKINLDNAFLELERVQGLYEAGVISKSEYDALVFQLAVSKQQLEEAKESLEVIQKGASKNSGQVLNEIRATISGTVLSVGALAGDQVTESNNFSEGTTIATIADMESVYFLGKVDESEVGKLKKGMPVLLSIGAIEDYVFNATLDFISPKGIDEEGTVKFNIQATIEQVDSIPLRAGYSANAEIVLDKREKALSISEGNVMYKGDSTFVEIMIGEQQFEKRIVVLGLSNGLQVEIVSGIDSTHLIKARMD